LQLHHDTEERIVDGLAGPHPDQRPAVASLDRKAGSLQRGVQFETGTAISLRRCETDLDVFARPQRQDFDFGIQRLPQCRAYGDRSEACCPGKCRHEENCGEYHKDCVHRLGHNPP
jgi:hypothetical protein